METAGEGKSVAVFRTVVFDRVDETVCEARSREPGATITVFGHLGDGPRLSAETRKHSTVVESSGSRFSPLSNGLQIARELRRRNIRRAIVPVRVSSVREAISDYVNVLLILLFGGVTSIAFRTRSGHWLETDRLRIFLAALTSLVRMLLAPLSLPAIFLKILRIENSPKNPVIALGGEPNDWVCHLAKANWTKSFGYFGVAYTSYLGNPFCLTYPPLSIGALRTLGVKWLTLSILGGYLIAAGLLSIGRESLGATLACLLASAYFLVSPIQFGALIRIGRPEVLGWVFGLLSAASILRDQPILGILFCLLALYTHQFSGAGAVAIATTAGLATGAPPQAIGVGLLVVGLLALPWWIPFLRASGRLGFWRFRTSVREFGLRREDLALPTLSWALFGGFALALQGMDVSRQATWIFPLVLMTGVSAFMLLTRKYLAHPFSIELGMTHTAWLLTLAFPSLTLCLAFAATLFFNATYGGRASYAIRPVYAKDCVEGSLELAATLPEGSRIAHEFSAGWNVETDWAWLLGYGLSFQNRVEMLGGIAMDQVEALLPLEYESQVHLRDGVQRLQSRMARVGVTHVAAWSEDMARGLSEAGWSLVSESTISGVVREARRYRLFQIPNAKGPLSPHGSVLRQRGRLILDLPAAGTYSLAYAFVRNWVAADELDAPVPLLDARPGMALTVARPTKVTLRFRMWA